MAGQLDSLFKNVAKSVVKDLGTSLDTSITYVRKASATYNVATGAVTSTDTSYSFKAPVEFIAAVITPDQIGDNQANLQDEISLTFNGSSRATKIQDIRTFRGGQEYLYMIRVVF